jgi:hypothetical protein
MPRSKGHILAHAEKCTSMEAALSRKPTQELGKKAGGPDAMVEGEQCTSRTDGSDTESLRAISYSPRIVENEHSRHTQ